MIEFFSFFVTAAYWPGLPGMALTPRWALLSILVPASILWLSPERIQWRRSVAWAGIALLVYAALSLLWTTSLPDGLNGFWQLSLLGGLTIIGHRLASLDRVFLGCAIGMGVSSGFIILEVLGVDLLQQLTQLRPGLFFNPNVVTETSALILVGCLAYRQYWTSLLVLPALILTHSRGGMAALAIVGIVWVWKRAPSWSVPVTAALAGLVLFVSLQTRAADDSEFRAGIIFNSQSVRDRINIWEDVIQGLTWMGTGIGSFRAEFMKAPYKSGQIVKGRADHAHNDYLEMAYELGLVDFGCFVFLIWNGFWNSRNVINFVLLAFSVEAFFQFPLHMPVTGALAALCVGHLAKR